MCDGRADDRARRRRSLRRVVELPAQIAAEQAFFEDDAVAVIDHHPARLVAAGELARLRDRLLAGGEFAERLGLALFRDGPATALVMDTVDMASKHGFASYGCFACRLDNAAARGAVPRPGPPRRRADKKRPGPAGAGPG